MRVTVNYGLEFEEIPKLLQDIIESGAARLNKADGLMSTLSYSLTKENIEFLKEAVHDLRLVLSRLDLEMGEVESMAVSYLKAKEQIAEQIAEQETQQLAQEMPQEGPMQPDLGIADDE